MKERERQMSSLSLSASKESPKAHAEGYYQFRPYPNGTKNIRIDMKDWRYLAQSISLGTSFKDVIHRLVELEKSVQQHQKEGEDQKQQQMHQELQTTL